MPHSNIPIFIPHSGCPNNCSFCNQHVICDTLSAPKAKDVTEILSNACENITCSEDIEIAFFGGSFTAVDRGYMVSLLNAAKPFIQEYNLSGIRISTRPDCINDEILSILKDYNVTSIELGAQSMCDHVLLTNDRGHTAEDIRNSVRLIKDYGFSLGLQMMVGLYNSSYEDELFTANEIIALAPETVRIYPVVILLGTKLAELYQSGVYKPSDFDAVVSVCTDLLELFASNNINVIKLGLHSSESVESQILGGFYHPAFREICEGMRFRRMIEDSVNGHGNYNIYVSSRDLSKAIGHRKSNIIYFRDKGINVKIIPDSNLFQGKINVKKQVN